MLLCRDQNEAKEALLNALSVQVLADSIVDTTTGEQYGVEWSVNLVPIGKPWAPEFEGEKDA